MNHLRWNILTTIPADHPINSYGFSSLIAQLLYNRGVTEPSQIEQFLKADSRLSGDPWLIPDMHQAVTRTYRALLSGEHIAVYGDFDADGITGTALLVQGLEALGGNITPYIPHRLEEGHGLNSAALEYLQQDGASLVISVDCGITGISQTAKAKKKGLDIIITDHHTPLEELPPAIANIDPKRADSDYPFSDLAGVGVAFKFLQALYQSMGREAQLNGFLDLVALGTVADMMPLLGENRYLVKQGLNLINTQPRPGIREMALLAGITTDNLNTDDISWILAPRLNATGRLEHALSSYKLMITDSEDEARQIAMVLEEKNAERQRLTIKALSKAREQILGRGITPILIASDNDYPAGIIGLVAGRLTDEFYRPSLVIRTGDSHSSGSCRSIPEFNIIQALNYCRNLFSRFGGHARAAGFTLPTKNLPYLEQQLRQMAAKELAGIDLRPRLDIDARTTLHQLRGNTYKSIQELAPFGQGNQPPVFISQHVEVADCQSMGNNGEHLRLKLKQNGVTWDAVAFRLGNCLSEVHSFIDIVYNLKLEQWCGQERLRLNILDFAPANQ
ncbi:MAG TPA: single-stranded-DNA-specific exonuclease RecJ [Dehalococcoidia bacterium]|nr:single-stranded-DNA-specific exonuclease RecJ [Dehalococcoidia bacterium]